MIDSKNLHNEANKKRFKMQSKINDADKANRRAESYMKMGDFNKASFESEAAKNDYKEALELEQEAIECDHRATDLEKKAYIIEQQENNLIEITREKIEALEKQRKKL